jgi:hypothetical protein
MFTLIEKPSFTAPVSFHIPADGGKTQKVEFSVVFRFLPTDEVNELTAQLDAQRLKDLARRKLIESDPERALREMPTDSGLTDREVINRVLAGFGRDLQGEDRQPLEFTQANLDRLLRVNGAQRAIVASFFENHFRAPEKN